MDLRTSPPADESGHAIVDFLDEHRLPHSPENYGFAHTYFEGADEAHFMVVANLIDGGYRLRQEDVRAISAPADLHGTATTIGELSTEVMHIIGATAQEANAFVKSLTLTAAELVSTDGNIHSAVARMTAQAERAEERLKQMSLQTALVRERLRSLGVDTDIDPATSLLNRIAIDSVLTAALGREGPTLLALVALDQVTSIGAAHGIGVVERVLRALGQTLRDHCMPHRVGRWEAKRIAIVFDNCDPEAARDMLNAARKAFSRRKLQRVENETPIGEVTCSAGLVLAPNAVSEDLIADAADALARASNGLGNRVILEQPAARPFP